MDIDKLGVTLGLSFYCLGVAIVLGIFIYADFCMCGDTTTEEITILHKYNEDTLMGTNYYYIDINEIAYQIWGDAKGARFCLLKCNQTYNVAYCGNGTMRVSCSEEKT